MIIAIIYIKLSAQQRKGRDFYVNKEYIVYSIIFAPYSFCLSTGLDGLQKRCIWHRHAFRFSNFRFVANKRIWELAPFLWKCDLNTEKNTIRRDWKRLEKQQEKWNKKPSTFWILVSALYFEGITQSMTQICQLPSSCWLFVAYLRQ